MVNTLRIKMLKEITEDAIRQYSESFYSASWILGVEDEVLKIIINGRTNAYNFREYQLNAMKDLIRESYWVKYRETEDDHEIVLTKIKDEQMNYAPGKGYRDGYSDRQQGKPNLSLIETTLLENNNPYWNEYKLGYADADRKIIDEARSSVNGKTFLVD